MNDDLHRQYRGQLVDLAHGELRFWDAFLLRRHIARCPACRREWAEVERVWGSLRRLSPGVSTRPRLKGKAMQVRVALAVSTALVCIVGGSVASRVLRQHASPLPVAQAQRSGVTTFSVSSLNQFWRAEARGSAKLLIYGPDGQEVGAMAVWNGRQTADEVSVHVGVAQAPPVDLNIRMDEKRAVENAGGTVLASVTCIPLSAQEIADFEARDREDAQRREDIYRKPECITLDTVRHSGSGYVELPGLIVWSLDYMRDDKGVAMMGQDGTILPLDNGGLAWKVYGDARVTMTLLTGPTPLVRHYKTLPRRSDTPVGEGAPKVYWFQSEVSPTVASFPDAAPGENVSLGLRRRYWINPDGTFYRTRARGTFSGYGKHIITGENGNPLMILDVTPP